MRFMIDESFVVHDRFKVLCQRLRDVAFWGPGNGGTQIIRHS